MHCVNKVKLPQFSCQQFEIIKKLNDIQIILINEQHSECNIYEEY
jgi:hypothetical protein